MKFRTHATLDWHGYKMGKSFKLKIKRQKSNKSVKNDDKQTKIYIVKHKMGKKLLEY